MAAATWVGRSIRRGQQKQQRQQRREEVEAGRHRLRRRRSDPRPRALLPRLGSATLSALHRSVLDHCTRDAALGRRVLPDPGCVWVGWNVMGLGDDERAPWDLGKGN